MPHRIFYLCNSLLGDILLFVSLQIAVLNVDNTLKLQFSGLVGSMLAVRTIEGKIGISDWLRVSVSGMVLANFLGYFWCDYRGIVLESVRAYFVFFVLGFFSDIILRVVKTGGDSFVGHVPDLIKTLLQKVKSLIFK